jgi:hypothetical protein
VNKSKATFSFSIPLVQGVRSVRRNDSAGSATEGAASPTASPGLSAMPSPGESDQLAKDVLVGNAFV